jgi:hypothetical protein
VLPTPFRRWDGQIGLTCAEPTAQDLHQTRFGKIPSPFWHRLTAVRRDQDGRIGRRTFSFCTVSECVNPCSFSTLVTLIHAPAQIDKYLIRIAYLHKSKARVLEVDDDIRVTDKTTAKAMEYNTFR